MDKKEYRTIVIVSVNVIANEETDLIGELQSSIKLELQPSESEINIVSYEVLQVDIESEL